jgi:hypothetical protein
MKSKILAISFIWAAVIIASALLLHGPTKHPGALFAIIVASATTSVLVLSVPSDRKCARVRDDAA